RTFCAALRLLLTLCAYSDWMAETALSSLTCCKDRHDLPMKLFYAPGSSSLLPHIVLYEAGLPFVAVRINEHSKVIEGGGDFRSVNPLGYVPALVLDDGTLLTEGAAIVQYIADQVPSKNLAPPNGTIYRTKLQSWLNFCSSEMHKGSFSPLF